MQARQGAADYTYIYSDPPSGQCVARNKVYIDQYIASTLAGGSRFYGQVNNLVVFYKYV